MQARSEIATTKTYIILGAPIKELVSYKLREDVTVRRDSFTLEEFASSQTKIEYYLGSEAIGVCKEQTTSPWVFRGEAPYSKSLKDKGLNLIGKGQGQVIGLSLESSPWPDGVEIKPSAIDKARKVLRELLPHYKGSYQVYAITEAV